MKQISPEKAKFRDQLGMDNHNHGFMVLLNDNLPSELDLMYNGMEILDYLYRK